MVDAVSVSGARSPRAEALDDSPTLARAAAKLRGAGEALRASDVTELPRLDAKLSANRVDVKPEALGARQLPVEMPLNLYLASVNVSYTFDFFGGTRAEIDALGAAVDVERYRFEAARQMLAGNVVTTAVRMASLAEQVADLERALALQARQLSIAEKLEEAGGLARADVVARREELARSRAALPNCGAISSRPGTASRSTPAAPRARRAFPRSASPTCSSLRRFP
jgi:outer membrane protein TolC